MNQQLSRTVGWRWVLPHLKAHPLLGELARAAALDGLSLSASAREAIGALQARLAADGFDVRVDQRLGRQTWRAVLAHPEAQAHHQAVRDADGGALEIAGVPVRMNVPDVVFRPMARSAYRFRGYVAGRADVQAVVVHWGGLNVEHCHRSLDGPLIEADGHLSTHLLIEHELRADQTLVVHQGVDLAHTAWHAGRINGASVGVDICRSPLLRFAHHYPDASVLTNDTGRGEPEYVDLDAPHGAACRRAIEGVAALFGIEPQPYPGHSVLPNNQRLGIIGHHHVSPKKWDVAVWAEHLWDVR